MTKHINRFKGESIKAVEVAAPNKIHLYLEGDSYIQLESISKIGFASSGDVEDVSNETLPISEFIYAECGDFFEVYIEMRNSYSFLSFNPITINYVEEII